MLTAIKIRIYPSTKQEGSLAKAFGCARWLCNNSLAETQKVCKEGIGQFALNKRLPELKKEFEWLAETHSQVLQSVNLNMSRAFANFFEHRAKYPNFKSKNGKQSIQYPQGVKIVEGRKIFLPKIGYLKARVHRNIAGTLKTVTVSRNQAGHYFASVLAENGITAPTASFDGKILGIDVGLTHLAVTSDGSKFDNPRHLARAASNLKRKQQKLSRKMKGSHTRHKARVMAVEDLHVKGMMENHCLAKAIGDVGWRMFTGFIEYKLAKDLSRWTGTSPRVRRALVA